MPGTNLKIAFWGTSKFSVYVLDKLLESGISPALIVTTPAKPKGRGLALLPSDTKVWADQHNIKTLEPTEIRSEHFQDTIGKDWGLFIVASYGKIIPRHIIDLPKHGTLNVHPSLLPKLRGATPLQSAILENIPTGGSHETGVTVMLIDEEVDHGPLIAQASAMIPNWPPKESELEQILGELGGTLLAETIPKWAQGEITPTEQNHGDATYTKKIAKVDAHIDLDDNPTQAYRKIQAFNVWPRAYFTVVRGDREIRVVVTDAHLENGVLVLDKVIPESKREMTYEEFKRG